MSRICFALDGMSGARAKGFVEVLEPHVAAFKVGLELCIKSGDLPKTLNPIVQNKLRDGALELMFS